MNKELVKVQEEMRALNINAQTSDKGGLTYLSWANAWAEVLKLDPEATYNIRKNVTEGPLYMTPLFGNSTTGFMVYTELTIKGLTREMWLMPADFRNKTLKNPDMAAVNKTVMRCLTKNIAMFGLGLYIYQGQDLPEESDVDQPAPEKKPKLIAIAVKLKKLAERAKLSERQMLNKLEIKDWYEVANNKQAKDLVADLEKFIETKGY